MSGGARYHRPKKPKRLHLFFPSKNKVGSLEIGSWVVPDPGHEPQKFCDMANEIGFHVLHEIAKNKAQCCMFLYKEDTDG